MPIQFTLPLLIPTFSLIHLLNTVLIRSINIFVSFVFQFRFRSRSIIIVEYLIGTLLDIRPFMATDAYVFPSLELVMRYILHQQDDTLLQSHLYNTGLER